MNGGILKSRWRRAAKRSCRNCGISRALVHLLLSTTISLSSMLLPACHERTMAPGGKANGAESGANASNLSADTSATNCQEANSENQNTNENESGVDLGALAWIEDERDRWLFVREIKGEAKGAWATGDFNRERNKIDIRTHDVSAFAIETSRMSVNWNRPVVLGIDGSNSELKRRDESLILFEIDKYGAWVVREKPKSAAAETKSPKTND